MKFFKKAEFILPSCVLLFGILWVFFSEEINAPAHSAMEVLTSPDSYQDALFVVIVSTILFIVLRNHRIKSQESAKEIRKLSLVAQITSNGVIISNNEGRIEWVNDAFTKVTGYTLEEVKGKSPSSVLHGTETDARVAAELIQHAAEGKSITRQIINYKKDGTPQWLQVSLSPVLVDSKREYTIAVQTNITQLKMHEKKIECQNKQLKDIAYKTSHLVRAPLANILGLAAVIKANGCENANNEELLHLLQVSAVQLDNVVKDIVLQTIQINETTPSS